MSKLFMFAVALFFLSSTAQAEEIYPGYEWREVGDGVYLHMRDDPFAGPVDGNSVVIVNDEDVVVIDTHINPAVARAVAAKIKSLTDNPVSHIINTHWHDDHVNGNQTFIDAFPGAKIVAHPYTAEKLGAEWRAFEDDRMAAYETVTVERLNGYAASIEESDPDRAIGVRVYAGYVAALKSELPEMKLAYPDIEVDGQMIFDRGARTILVQWIGAGNTEGDLSVWLPEEKILITGDIVVAPVPYAFDSPMKVWRKTLERLAGYDAKTIIPGHGAPMEDASYINQLSTLIDETLAAVKKAKDEGVAYDDLASAVDLSTQEKTFAGEDPVAVNAWNSYFVTPGLKSAWAAMGYEVPEEADTE